MRNKKLCALEVHVCKIRMKIQCHVVLWLDIMAVAWVKVLQYIKEAIWEITSILRLCSCCNKHQQYQWLAKLANLSSKSAVKRKGFGKEISSWLSWKNTFSGKFCRAKKRLKSWYMIHEKELNLLEQRGNVMFVI